MTTSDAHMIAALRREREMYQNQRKTDRVAQVDEQLQRLGYTPDGEEDAGPQGRTSRDPAQQSADAGTGDAAGANDQGAAAAAAEPEPKKPAAAKKTAASSRAASKE